jgi:hypothetical protein
MNDERDQGVPGADPEERAFTGGPDGPPQEPDQPPAGNEELERSTRERKPEPESQANPHGEYPNLPGYGG